MYLRVVTSQIKTDSVTEAIQIWRDQLIPILKEIKGYKCGYLSGDRNSGKSMAISIWETEADATTFYTSGKYAEIMALFASHFAAAPTQELFEVFAEV